MSFFDHEDGRPNEDGDWVIDRREALADMRADVREDIPQARHVTSVDRSHVRVITRPEPAQ